MMTARRRNVHTVSAILVWTRYEEFILFYVKINSPDEFLQECNSVHQFTKQGSQTGGGGKGVVAPLCVCHLRLIVYWYCGFALYRRSKASQEVDLLRTPQAKIPNPNVYLFCLLGVNLIKSSILYHLTDRCHIWMVITKNIIQVQVAKGLKRRFGTAFQHVQSSETRAHQIAPHKIFEYLAISQVWCKRFCLKRPENNSMV